MIFDIKYEKYYKDNILSFLKDISKKKNWNINTLINLFQDGIKINPDLFYYTNNNLCQGLVITNGVKKQCSRNKKYNNLCGLHFNKKNKYGKIQYFNQNIIYLDNLNSNYYQKYNNIIDKNINKIYDTNSTNNDIISFSNFDKIFQPIYIDNTLYFYNYYNTILYIKQDNKYIPFKKYNFSKNLFIDNCSNIE